MGIFDRRKTTFAFLILAGLAASASAQFIGRTATVAQLGACNGTRQVAVVTDATNATTLGTGGGSATVWVTCATGSWTIAEVAAVSDLSAYLPVSATTAAPVVIQVSGAGNDVSLIASDDVILTPTDALTATVGGAAAVTTTAGAITLTAGGTTEDISLISVDQVIVDGAGGADELVIDDDEVLVGSAAAFRLAISSASPVACASGTKASMYYDSDINKVCICNGTNYVLANDDSTTTGCS